MLRDFTLTRLVAATVAVLAVLMAIGWATRENPQDKPLLAILGGGFMFNYREAEVFYGFTAQVTKPLETGSVIEARFENPAGGEALVVRKRVSPVTDRYALRSPPIRGVTANRPYHVAVRVLDRTESQELWATTLDFESQISDDVVPTKPLIIGPGYTKNPEVVGG